MKILTIIFFVTAFSGCLGAEDELNEITIVPDHDVIRNIGGSATLTCISQSEDISDIKWIGPDLEEIVAGSNPKRNVDEVSNQSVVLELQDLSFDDNGEYRCRGFSASLNTSIETTKMLVVYDQVEFVDTPETQELLLGDTASVICNLKGNPEPTVSWLLDGRKLELDSSEKYFKNGTNLGIRDISKDDERTYLCKGRQITKGLTKEMDIQLIVNVPPTIENFINESTVVAGDVHVFNCEASGYPEPQFSWYTGDGTGGDEFLSYGSVLSLNIHQGMNRSYTCIAQNKVSADSATLSLDIQVKPSFSVAAGNETLEKKPTSLKCVAEGIPTPTVRIYRDDIMLENSSDVESENETSEFGNWSENQVVIYTENTATVKFNYTQFTDHGKYECRAENEAGFNSTDIMLDVKYAPREKMLSNKWACAGGSPQLDCEFHGNPTPTLAWGRYVPLEGADDNENATMKYVAIDPSNSTNGFEIISTGGILSLIVDTGVAEEPFGTYVCSAQNSVGSNNATAKLIEAERPYAPIGVQVSNVTTSEATITFARLESLVPYVSFIVRLEPASENVSTSVMSLEPTEDEAMFSDLVHDTEYTVIVEANTCAGTSDGSETLKFKTVAIESPEPVKIISGKVSDDHDKYTVEWKPGNTGGGNINKILITLYEVKVDIDADNLTKIDTYEVQEDLSEDNGSFTIEDLDPNTEYEISVEIYNEVGFAPASQRFRTNTKTTTDAATTQASVLTAGTDRKLIIIIVIVLLVLVLIIDITCCVTRRCGLSYWIFAHTCGKGKKHDIEDAEEGSAEYRKSGVEEAPAKVEVEEEKQPLADDVEPIANGEPGITKLDPIDEQTPLQNDGATGGQPAATENGTAEGAKEQEETAEKVEEKNDHSEQEKLVQCNTDPSA